MGSTSFRSNIVVFLLCAQCSELGKPIDLGEQRAEIGRLGHAQASRPILGGKPEGIASATDEAADLALGRLVPPAVAIRLEPTHADDLIDDSRQLAAGLAAFDLRLPVLAVELIDDPLQD